MDHLLTEARNPASTRLDELSPLELVRLMNAEDARVIPAVAAQAEVIAQAIERTAERLGRGGRLVYTGAGTSGRLGVLDAAECPPTFSVPPGLVIGVIAGGSRALTTAVEGAEDRPDSGEEDLRSLNFARDDVLVGIATSGRTPYVCGALAYARAVGALTIGFACTPDSDLMPLADLMIAPLVGPEILTGSTRLKAGTATKLVLNMLSTGVMVRLGKTYGNLMVDLRATNVKLRARTNRIVRHFTGMNEPEATELLSRCGGELKTALVAAGAGLSAEKARQRLHEVGGQVRRALEGLTAPRPSIARDLVLGVDGGGTGTVALLALRDGGKPVRVIGRGESGPSNVQAVGAERATAAIEEATSRAFHAAGRPRGPVQAACLGLAGAGRPEDQAIFTTWAGRMELAEKVEVLGDADLLLAAGTPEDWGLALVAGTGSIAWGRLKEERRARAGGWGPLLGDEASGYALALAGLRAVVRAADGRGSATLLTEKLLDRLWLTRPEELVGVVHRQLDRSGIAALAPVVLDTADAGDAVAVRIVAAGAEELATAGAAVVAALGLTGQRVPLALAGGLLLGREQYRRAILERLSALGVVADPITLVAEPAEGAVRRAARACSAPNPSSLC